MNQYQNERARAWAGIVYLDSLPKDWLDYLKNLHVPLAVSPLHAPESPEFDSNQLKEHYHILLCFEGKKSYKQVSELLKPLHGTRPELVHSISGYARYLIHMDDPNKEQFDPRDVTVFSGFDYWKYIVPVLEEKKKNNILEEMDRFLLENNVVEIQDLLRYSMEHEPDWYSLLQSPSYLNRMSRIVTSLRYSGFRTTR